MNIVIIDDEPKIRNGMSKLLGRHDGWEIVGVFAAAPEAVQFLYEHEVDVIITDIQMPGMSGLDLISAIRTTNPAIPVIILSGYSRFDYAQRAIELGVRKYLTKPTSPEEITQALLQVEMELQQKMSQLQQQLPAGVQVHNLLVLRAIEYMQKHFSGKLTLGDVAGALYISPNYLSELFKKTMDIKFSDYLLNIRMEKSKKYLEHVSFKISDVTAMVGFSDARYFSSAFKKKYGMTPLEYRNKVLAAGAGTDENTSV